MKQAHLPAVQIASTILILSIVFWVCIPIGWVGEVTSLWTVAPQTSLSETLSCLGDLCLYPTRPILRWDDLPIWHNVYTGGFPDWLQYGWFHTTENTMGIRILQILFSAFLVVQICLWSRQILSKDAQWWLWVWLCSDWSFLFYKKALGTTEIGLQWALMLSLFMLLQPQQAQTKRLAWVIALGIWCKITFVLVALPLFGLLIGLEQDTRKNLAIQIVIGFLAGLLPHLLLLGWTSQIDITVRSHDFWTLQWERIQEAVSGNNTSIREQNSNLWIWLFDPLQFFTKAYGVEAIPWHGWGKIAVYISTLLAGWQLRTNKQWCRITLFLGTIVFLLTWIAKDLHHLAMATPLLGLWMVYTFDRVTWQRAVLFTIGGLWFGSQLWTLIDAPKVINAVETPTFSEARQQHLEDFIKQHNVTELITMDYEVYGVLEARMPDLSVTHMWPKISTERWDALPDILGAHKGSHLLVLKSSMPMSYNLQPSEQRLKQVAQETGSSIKLVESIDGVWLYKIR